MSNINGNIIKENGITFYMESSSSKVCIDIDVDERLETFEFIKSDKVREYKLKNLKKSFPNIKKLVISSRIYIYISNTLFPNVREVDCGYYANYKPGKVLIREGNYYSGRTVVTNTFCCQTGEAVDLKGVNEIPAGAFEGCESTKIINATGVKKCSNQAFRNSAIGRMRPEHGKALIVGSILVDFDKTTGNIVIPDNKQTVTAIRDGLDFEGVKTITVHRISHNSIFLSFLVFSCGAEAAA